MEMTELQECLEVSVLSVPLPLGNVCHPALRKCHYWFVSMRWQHCKARPLREHTIYIREQIFTTRSCMQACTLKYKSILIYHPCYFLIILIVYSLEFREAEHTVQDSKPSHWVCHRPDGDGLQTMAPCIEKSIISQREGGKILLCLISSNIFQGWYSLFLFFSMEWPLWNTEWLRRDKRTLGSCFLVPSAWQNKIIHFEVTGVLASSPQEPSISFIWGILLSAKRHPWIISLNRRIKAFRVVFGTSVLLHRFATIK